MDLTDTVEPKSDQMNADDLLSGPRTFTITEVRRASSVEQPVDVYLAEFPKGRPFRPSKSMRRVMIAGWGKEAAVYAGRRLTLYRDPEIKFAGEAVGGVRISHMSHIEKRLTLALTVTRGKRSPYVVDPLPNDAPTSPPVDESTVARLAELRAEWKEGGLSQERVEEIRAEVEALEQQKGQSEPSLPTSPDDDAVWQQILDEAGRQGLSRDEVRELFPVEMSGAIVQDATSEELRAFLAKLQAMGAQA